MELSMDNFGMEELALVQLIDVLGNTLARLQATRAKEEYELQQIDASIKFVNHTIDAWINSSQEQVLESSEVHVYKSNFFEVSNSIEAILEEARLERGAFKLSASPKRPLSIPCNVNIAETARKSKAIVHKKKLERFSQALRIGPKKTINSVEDAKSSSFFVAREMLLKWMENKKDSWIYTGVEQQYLNSIKQSNPCLKKCFLKKSDAEIIFMDSLWNMHSISSNSLTNAKDDNICGNSNKMSHKIDDLNTIQTKNEVQTMPQRLQTNLEVLQEHSKLLNKHHMNANLLHGGEDFPFLISNVEEKQCQQDISNNEESSMANYDCWLPAEVCWKVLETKVKGTVMEHATQPVPIYYSNLQQALNVMQLMHSIHSKLFHCHLQSLLAQSLLKPSNLLSKKVDDVLNNSIEYLCLRQARCIVCKNDKALLSIGHQIDIS